MEKLERFAVEDHDLRLASICHVHIALLSIWRKRDAGGGLSVAAIRCVALTSNEDLVDEFTGDGEYLTPPAAAIRDIYEAVGRDLHGVYRWHELRSPIRPHRLLLWPCRCDRVVDRHGHRSNR